MVIEIILNIRSYLNLNDDSRFLRVWLRFKYTLGFHLTITFRIRYIRLYWYQYRVLAIALGQLLVVPSVLSYRSLILLLNRVFIGNFIILLLCRLFIILLAFINCRLSSQDSSLSIHGILLNEVFQRIINFTCCH